MVFLCLSVYANEKSGCHLGILMVIIHTVNIRASSMVHSCTVWFSSVPHLFRRFLQGLPLPNYYDVHKGTFL